MQEVPLKKKFIRGLSYMTGFLLKGTPDGCEVSYITQSDPRGQWLLKRFCSSLWRNQVVGVGGGGTHNTLCMYTVIIYDACSFLGKIPKWIINMAAKQVAPKVCTYTQLFFLHFCMLYNLYNHV